MSGFPLFNQLDSMDCVPGCITCIPEAESISDDVSNEILRLLLSAPALLSLPSLPGPFFNRVEEICEGNNFRNSGFGL